nr:MAG TPA: hypothetical protein [Bacteriophage sp.]
MYKYFMAALIIITLKLLFKNNDLNKLINN